MVRDTESITTNKIVTRRNILKTIGGSAALSIGGIGTASAHRGRGVHWRNGSVLHCLLNPGTVFNSIYNSMKEWEHRFVRLSHSDWNGDVRIRVGDVLRVSNSGILNTWEYYYEDGNGEDDLGDDMQMICGATWGISDPHVWSYQHHIGRVNGLRAAGSQTIARKYWYHELGHAHTLCHRNEGGALMNPDSPTGLEMNRTETSQWYDVYDEPQSCPSNSSISSQDEVVTESPLPNERVAEAEEIEPPRLVESKPIEVESVNLPI